MKKKTNKITSSDKTALWKEFTDSIVPLKRSVYKTTNVGHSFEFFVNDLNLVDQLLEIGKRVDNSVTTVYIQTPKGWKCKRNGCLTDYKHLHSTYEALRKKD